MDEKSIQEIWEKTCGYNTSAEPGPILAIISRRS